MSRPYYWKLTPAADRDVRKRFTARIVARHKRNWSSFEDEEWPVIEFPSGREELAFYREQGIEWWANLAATFPDRAAWRARRYAALIRRYGQRALEAAGI